MNPPGSELLRRLETQLLGALAEGSEVVATSAFRLHVWRTPDPFYRNVAVPVADGADRRPAIDELRAACARHDRRPRVEFFAELWRGLDRALAEAGFTIEARGPVLTATAAPAGHAEHGPAVRRLGPTTPRPVLQACLEAAAGTFHEPAAMLAPGELERLQDGLAAGSIRSAVVFEDGAPVSGASLSGRGAVAELLGVWTAPAHRRRGLAGAVCRSLLTEFFATGGEVAWLTAGSAASRALYERLGFEPCGTHLDYADPGTSGPLPTAHS